MGQDQATNHHSEPLAGGKLTTVSALRLRLGKRWARGKPLADYALGQWKPVSIKLTCPSADEWADRPIDAEVWAMGLYLGSVDESGQTMYRIETGPIAKGSGSEGNRADHRIGPVRVWFDSISDLAAFVGAPGDVCAYDRAESTADSLLPELSVWVRNHAKKVVAVEHVWDQLLGTVEWIRDHDPTLHYLNQIDVAGVNTQFVEKHRRVLDSMLSEILASDRVDRSSPLAEFGRRYGFRQPPTYVRLRASGGVGGWPSGLSEMTIRSDELAGLELDATYIFLIENLDACTSFPLPAGGVAVSGWAFSGEVLATLATLAGQRLFFWGDTDARGYIILNLLRERCESVQPVLMDEAVLAAHLSSVVDEGTMYRSDVPHLRPNELRMYASLTGVDGGLPMGLPAGAIAYSWVKLEVASLELSEAL